MSKPISVFDVDDDEEERALQEAYDDIAAGRVVPHDEVMRWIASWGTPNELPMPTPKPRQQCQ